MGVQVALRAPRCKWPPEGAEARFSAEGAEERAQGLARLRVAMTRARDPLFLNPSSSPIVEPPRAGNLLEWLV